ncbi:MAG: GNAT family N-acetyltransferase [Chitinophagales bacterium]
MNINIRKAVSADMPSIFKLVNELAIYERSGDEVATNAEQYKKDLEANYFEAIVAEDQDENKIIGMALYYFPYSTWKGRYIWLEDFVVENNYRGKGVGKLLFDEMIRITKQHNTFLKWQVLDWNEPAIHFYKKYNASFEKQWVTCRLSC